MAKLTGIRGKADASDALLLIMINGALESYVERRSQSYLVSDIGITRAGKDMFPLKLSQQVIKARKYDDVFP